MLLPLLTHSRMTAYRTCPRKHQLAYELGLRPAREARPLRFGDAFHQGLDAHAQGRSEEEAIAAAVSKYDEIPDWATTEEQLHDWLTERETVGRLLAGYFWYWRGWESPLRPAEVLASEKSYRLPLRNPETGRATTSFEFGGKRDKIVRLADGRVAVMEHKTCSEDLDPESEYWLRLRIDQQISGYYTSAIDEGYPVETVLYDVVRKPSIRPSQIPLTDEDGVKIVLNAAGERVKTKDGKKWRESGDAKQGLTLQTRLELPGEFGQRLIEDIMARPAWYYARREIPRLDADLEEYRHELWQVQQQIRDSQVKGRWPRNTAACRSFNTACPYFTLCTNSYDPASGAVPPGFVKLEDVHPELA